MIYTVRKVFTNVKTRSQTKLYALDGSGERVMSHVLKIYSTSGPSAGCGAPKYCLGENLGMFPRKIEKLWLLRSR